MDIKDLLAPEDARLDVEGADKAVVLAELAREAGAALGVRADVIMSGLLKREQLGSTGVGNGVAIPHARLAEVKRPFGWMARLRQAIDFESIDGRPVDLVFVLLLPGAQKGGELNALASVARRLRDPEVLKALRAAPDTAALYRALVPPAKTA